MTIRECGYCTTTKENQVYYYIYVNTLTSVREASTSRKRGIEAATAKHFKHFKRKLQVIVVIS